MSVTKYPVQKRLTIRWNVGLGPDMSPMYRVRSFNHVKFTASDEVLYQLGQLINTACIHVADSIRTNEEHELST